LRAVGDALSQTPARAANAEVVPAAENGVELAKT
jgi:hypothetical protein